MSIVISKGMTNGQPQYMLTIPNTNPWGSMNILVSNTTQVERQIKLFVSDSGGTTDVDTIEPGAIVPAKGRYELSCRLVRAGEMVHVLGDPGMAVRIEVNLATE